MYPPRIRWAESRSPRRSPQSLRSRPRWRNWYAGVCWRQRARCAPGDARHAQPWRSRGILSGDDQRRALDAGGFARQRVVDLHLPAAGFGPALVHPQQHAGPIAGFGAARTRVDVHDAVALIVAAIEKDLQFEGIEVFEELGEVLLQLLLNFGLGGLRLGFTQFHHDVEIFELLFRLEERLGLGAE